MKIIKLNESQFGRIFENIENGNYGESNYPEYKGSKITTQPSIDGGDGNKKPSDTITADDLQDQMGEQLPFGYGRY